LEKILIKIVEKGVREVSPCERATSLLSTGRQKFHSAVSRVNLEL